MVQKGHAYLHWEWPGRHLDENGVLHGYYPDDKDYYPHKFPFYPFNYISNPDYHNLHPPSHGTKTKFNEQYKYNGKVIEADIVKYYDDGQVDRAKFDVVRILEFDTKKQKYKVEYLVDTGKEMAKPYREHFLTREFLERVGHVLIKSTMNQHGGKTYKKSYRKTLKRKSRSRK